jgi:hypothetical protein
MPSSKHRSVLAVLILMVGLLGAPAAGAIWYVSRVANLEKPPCRSCSVGYYSTEIPVVPLCDLTKNADKFRGKFVRVQAKFQHDSGLVSLVDDTCGVGGRMHAGFSNSFESCAGAMKALKIYSGFKTWYDSTADVVVIGNVGLLENPTLFDDGKDGFNIICLEQASPGEFPIQDRIRYAAGELFRLNFP